MIAHEQKRHGLNGLIHVFVTLPGKGMLEILGPGPLDLVLGVSEVRNVVFPMVGDKPVIPNPEYPTRTKGVVEKCTFCPERLVLGKKPACVEATEGSGALVFGNLEDRHSEVREILSTHYTIQRKPELGTNPRVFYVIGG